MGRSSPAYHTPVLVREVVDLMAPAARSGFVVDATFGGGGHTRALLEAVDIPVLAIDRDPEAVGNAAGLGERVRFVSGNFRDLDAIVAKEGIDEIDGVVFDLGVSSHQLDVGERGFSYHRPGPLDMRMGPEAEHTAAELVNHWPEGALAELFRRFGEERYARRIAAAIIAARPIEDTVRLADVVAGAVPARSRRGGHPARRTFQALRIAVNDELAALGQGLDVAVRVLRSGGRLIVISYHSGEDRIVKRRLAAGARGCICPPDMPECGCGRTAELRLLTRAALTPTPEEIARNPRGRSAKLRAAEKVAS